MTLAPLVLFVALALLSISGGVLYAVSKLFQLQNPSFKKSLVIVFAVGMTGIAAGIAFGMVHLGLLAAILTFIIFHYLLHRYYRTGWLKSLAIYAVFSILAPIISLFFVLPLRLFGIEPFVVAGNAMMPTYESGDYLLVNKLDRNYTRGDVVIFRNPLNASEFFIQRVAGLPSERIEIREGMVLIDGTPLDESGYRTENTSGDVSVLLAKDQYFMLGDNRDESKDSRVLGPVPRENMLGTIFYRLPGLLE
ncbi:MAG TPA: signal peptidase I [Candidatus Paceibacterota bacterium]|nr:signal peptidase I [Candidatus Paceibacterota bacterium]